MNTGSALARFTITLSTAVTEPVQVEWHTSDGTAKASVDYAANKGTVVFAPGETAKTVDILVYGRAVGAEDRSFYVEMLPPTNAILGASIGECIIHVDTTGSTPVTQIIIPIGPQGIQGKSAYQSYVDTTTDNPPMTEPEWVESLKGDPEEIAQEVAPLIDVGDTTLISEGTDTLSKPDSTTVKAVARRVAYAGAAKIATVTLGDGDNLLTQANLTGDMLDFMASGFVPRILRAGAMFEPDWLVDADGKLLIKGAAASDVLYAVQYDLISSKNRLARLSELTALAGSLTEFESNLANTSDDGIGDALVGVKQPFPSTISKTQHTFNAETLRATDWGAAGDGVTLDDAAFQAIEADVSGRFIDLCGLTYRVTTAFIGNKYCNGLFKRADGQTIPALYHPVSVRSGRYIQAIGQDALFSVPELPNGSLATNLIAIGPRAMYNAVSVRNNYAIGYQALYSMRNGVYNTAFGFESLFYNNGSGDGITGSRNAAFGDNTMRFNTTGYNNLAFGRNAAQTNETGNSNIHVGIASGAGDCPVDLYGNIINTFPTNKTNAVAVGTSTLFYTASSGHTAIGSESLQFLKRGINNTAVGYLAGKSLEFDVSPTGKQMVTATATGTYNVDSGLVTVTQMAHGYATGDTVKIRFGSGPLNAITTDYIWIQISVLNSNTYTLPGPATASGTGTTTVTAKYNTTDSTTQCDFNTIVGYNALSLGTVAMRSVAVGAGTLSGGGKSDNTAVGFRAAVLLGETGNQIRNTAVGCRAMEFMQDGTDCVDVFNSSALGYQASVSGSSQVQLGNSATTTYVYGTVQNRSDERDKTDIRDTVLGIDFIMGLRPVDGRWDMRDDYYEERDIEIGVDENNQPIFKTERTLLTKDGSKKRHRYHHWFVAQEVNALCEKLGVDFGGYQDHKLAGGGDVLSLGYDEFIPPAIKAIQECWKRMDAIELRLAKLEDKE